MCGINGIFSFQKKQLDHRLLEQMSNQLFHRGPDSEGLYNEGGVGLSFRRLAIIDTEGAHQPLANENKKIWLVCNGEIYNYKQLRDDLQKKGHTFRTNGDAETILHLYEEYGVDCVHYLRGMFAFIIWDSHTNTFFAARDPFGIKPFYYSVDDQKLICSSELKSILKIRHQPKELDLESLQLYLTYQYVPEPKTMVKGINKLPPAHRIIVTEGNMKVERYWEATFEPTNEPFNNLREEIEKSLRSSVELHMQSDVPYGSFLSSGIDSTAIASLMREKGPLKTFSVGFKGQHNENV